MMVFIRTPYNYDTNAAGDESGLECKDYSRAMQQFKDDSDINVLAKRYGLDGKLPENVPMPMNMDFADGNVFDMHSAMNQVVAAREAFDAMPARVRARFGHDPIEFVNFCSDEKNFDEAVGLGLIRPEVAAKRAAEAEAKRKAEFDAEVTRRLEARPKTP